MGRGGAYLHLERKGEESGEGRSRGCRTAAGTGATYGGAGPRAPCWTGECEREREKEKEKERKRKRDRHRQTERQTHIETH